MLLESRVSSSAGRRMRYKKQGQINGHLVQPLEMRVAQLEMLMMSFWPIPLMPLNFPPSAEVQPDAVAEDYALQPDAEPMPQQAELTHTMDLGVCTEPVLPKSCQRPSQIQMLSDSLDALNNDLSKLLYEGLDFSSCVPSVLEPGSDAAADCSDEGDSSEDGEWMKYLQLWRDDQKKLLQMREPIVLTEPELSHRFDQEESEAIRASDVSLLWIKVESSFLPLLTYDSLQLHHAQDVLESRLGFEFSMLTVGAAAYSYNMPDTVADVRNYFLELHRLTEQEFDNLYAP